MPMRRHAGRYLLLTALRTGLVWLCLVGVAPAQDNSSAGDTVYHLHGVVVNALTGQAIGRALVQSGDRRIATLADSEGKFAVDISVPPKKTQGQSAFVGSIFGLRGYGGGPVLMAIKPGYLQDEKSMVPIALDETISSTNIEIKLLPAAVIAGHVSMRGSDVPRNVRVMLFSRGVNDGVPMWGMRNQQMTNGRGEFRFSNLAPGEYTLMTGEWHDDQSSPRPSPSAPSLQYAPMFFGDVRDIASATNIHLHYGQTAQAEFHLDQIAYYPVTIPLAVRAGNVGARVLDDSAFQGYGMSGGYQLRYNNRLQAVEGSLPAGTYNLFLNAFGDPVMFAELPIHVDNAPLRTAPVTLSPAATIAVHVRSEFTSNDREQTGQGIVRGRLSADSSQIPPVNLRLVSVSGLNGGNATRHPDGNVTVDNVSPGVFHVEAQVYNGYIASMTSGGVDLTQRPLIVANGSAPEPIEIVLRNDMSTISGTVTGLESNSARPDAVVMFLPADASARFQQTYVSRENKFTMSNLAPGSYRILAFRDLRQQLAYRDEATMHRLEGKGTTVTVAPGQSAQADVTVAEPPEVE